MSRSNTHVPVNNSEDDSVNDAFEEQQHTIIPALSRAEAYPHSVENIQLIETHISWVFLTGHYAYKIKKNVNFGFLDFSTLARRRRFCEEELRLNRRLAPALYLGVVPICGSFQKATINGTGEVIEYAVKMRQFDTQNSFDALLAESKLTPSHIDESAQVLARFHSGIAIADKTSSYGTAEAIRQPAMENFDQLALSTNTIFTDNAAHPSQQQLQQQSQQQLHRWTTNQHAKLIGIFEQRKNAGFIRECHGDLHLRNIVIWQGRVTPFDGIEFSDNLRWIDVISELAFLLMDLDDHQQAVLARQLLNTYLSLTGDYAGLRVLRYYQVYRAMVRAKVAGLRLDQNENKAPQLLPEINNYLQLAKRYTQTHAPQLIITHGLSGSGKSYLSKQLVLAADIIHLRSDVERKRCFGFDAQAKTHAGIYSPEATEKTYQHLLQLTRNILAAGFTVLVDATFLQRQYRDRFTSLADELQIPFTILHCTAKPETLRQRVQQRLTQANDASEANPAVLEKQMQHHEMLNTDEQRYTHTIQTAAAIDLKKLLATLNFTTQ